jgi:hypothetical protein
LVFNHTLKYLMLINIEKTLCRLRVSSHRLNIECVRWNRTVREYRLCKSCIKLEDEFHFLFECNMYDTIRDKYINRYYRVRPSMFKTIELFSSENVKVIRNLSVYVYKAFEIRRCRYNI